MMPPNCFVVSVEGIGDFTFRRRNFRFQGEIERFTIEFRHSDALLDIMVPFYDLVVLTQAAPPGWGDLDDPDAFDPLDPESTKRIIQVWERLREEEKKIRLANAENRKRAGLGA